MTSGSSRRCGEPDANAAAGPRQVIELVEHAAAAADGRADGGAGDAHLGERADAEDEARAEHDVDRVGEPQHAHRDGGVAGAAEHRVDEEQQQDGAAPAEHHAREACCPCGSPRRSRPSRPAAAGRTGARRRRSTTPSTTPRTIACTPARAAASGSFSPIRRATVAAAPIDRPMASGVDDRHQRLGDADGGDRVGAEPADEEDVHHQEHRLHQHLEHHRHGEQHDGAPDRRFGVVLVGPADGFAERGPDGVTRRECNRWLPLSG